MTCCIPRLHARAREGELSLMDFLFFYPRNYASHSLTLDLFNRVVRSTGPGRSGACVSLACRFWHLLSHEGREYFNNAPPADLKVCARSQP